MEKEKMVTIPERLYEKLMKDSEWLNYLEMTGVDNWEGYEIAIDRWEEDGKEEEYGEL